MYVCANRSQKRVLDSLQLGSQVLRSRRIGDRNQKYIFLEEQPSHPFSVPSPDYFTRGHTLGKKRGLK